MPSCIYDNPATMRREAWRDGRLIAFWSLELISFGFPAMGEPPEPWADGKLSGDPAALVAHDHVAVARDLDRHPAPGLRDGP